MNKMIIILDYKNLKLRYLCMLYAYRILHFDETFGTKRC